MLTSLGSTAVNVGATVLADLSEGGRLGPQLAMFRLTGDIALLLAPLLAGALYEVSGKTLAILPLFLFVAAVTTLAAWAVPETHPGPGRTAASLAKRGDDRGNRDHERR